MTFNPQPSTTAKSSKIKLSLLLNSTLFATGSRITGKLEITVLNEVLIKDITVSLNGFEEINLKNYHQTKSIISVEKRIQGDNMPISRVCQGPKTRDGYYPGKKGKTVFEFGFDLPIECPSSFAYHQSSVKYLVKAIVQFKQSINHSADTLFKIAELVVIQTIDQTLVRALVPVVGSQNSCKVLFGGDYPVTMTATIKSAYLCTYSSFPLTLIVDNASKKKLSGLKIQFLKKLVMINPSPDHEVKAITEIIQSNSLKEYSFDPQEETTIVLHPTVPDVYTIMNTNLSELSYSVLVSLSIPVFKELVVEIPIPIYHPKSLEPVQGNDHLEVVENILPEPTLPNTDYIDLECLQELPGTTGRISGDMTNSYISSAMMSNMSHTGSNNMALNSNSRNAGRRVSFDNLVKVESASPAFNEAQGVRDVKEIDLMRIYKEASLTDAERKSTDIFVAQKDSATGELGNSIQGSQIRDYCQRISADLVSNGKTSGQHKIDLAEESFNYYRRRNSDDILNWNSAISRLDSAKDLSQDSARLSNVPNLTIPKLPVRKNSTGPVDPSISYKPATGKSSNPSFQKSFARPPVSGRNSEERFNGKRERVNSVESFLSNFDDLDFKILDAPPLPHRNSMDHFNCTRDEFLSLQRTVATPPSQIEQTDRHVFKPRIQPQTPVQTRLPKFEEVGKPSTMGSIFENALAFLDLSPNSNTVETSFSKRMPENPMSDEDQETYIRKEDIHRDLNLPMKYKSRTSDYKHKHKSTLRRKPLPKPSVQPKMPPLETTFFDEDEDRTKTIRKAKVVSIGFDSDEEDSFWN